MYVMLYYLTDNNAVRLILCCCLLHFLCNWSLPTTNEIYCQSL